MQYLDVITAVRGANSGQATYINETLARNFWSDLGWDRIMAMVSLLMDQRWDLCNYLWERVTQLGILLGHTVPEVFAEIIQLLNLYSEVQQYE